MQNVIAKTQATSFNRRNLAYIGRIQIEAYRDQVAEIRPIGLAPYEIMDSHCMGVYKKDLLSKAIKSLSLGAPAACRL